MALDTRAVIPALVLLLLGLTLTLPFLGSSPLWDPWEPKYAQTPREMADRGDWIVPYYREDPRLVKPPLTYWLIGVSQGVLGLGEAAARLPSALFAALCPAALALALAFRGRRLEGFVAGAALLTAPQWLLAGRFATPDMPFAALLGLALAAVVAVPALPVARRLPLQAAAVVLVGLATLTEWPRGLVLPAFAVVAWGAARLEPRWIAALTGLCALYATGQHGGSAVLTLAAFGLAALAASAVLRREAGLSWRQLGFGALLLLVVVAPWFVTVFSLETAEATERLIGYKHGLNLGETPGQHGGPPHAVLRSAAVGALPWIAAAAVALLIRPGLRRKERDEPLTLFAGAWIGGLLFFSLSEAQMTHFYAVLLPPLAGLAGIGVVAAVRGSRLALAPALAVVGTVAWIVHQSRDPSVVLGTSTVKHALFDVVELGTPALLSLGSWAAIWLVAVARRRERWTPATVLPAAAFAAFLSWHALPALGDLKSTGPMLARYVELHAAGEPIASYGQAKDSMFYYSDNVILRLRSAVELRDYLTSPGPRFLLLTRRDLEKLRPGWPAGRLDEIDVRHPTHRLVRFEPGG